MLKRFLKPEPSGEDLETDKIAARRRDETVVLSSWFILFLGVLWITLGLFLNAHQLILLTILPMAGSALAIWAVPTPFNLIGRLLWMFSGLVVATLGCFIIHDAGNVQYLYAQWSAGRFWFFLFSASTFIFCFLRLRVSCFLL